MARHERQALISLLSTLVISVVYSAYVLQTYPHGDPYTPEAFRFWGTVILISIPATIAVRIGVQIAFNIASTMGTRERSTSSADERDRLIGLRGLRNSLYVFTVGLFVAVALLALDVPPTGMFVVLLLSGFAAGIVGDVSKLYFYRRGF